MNSIHPQFISDINGIESMVVLPINEFNLIIEELEELEDIRLYDKAKKNDTGEYILFSDYLKNRKKNV